MDGLTTKCKECRNAAWRSYAERERRVKADPNAPTKVCTRCGIEKPMSEFGPDTHNTTGRKSQCRECRNAVQRLRRAQPPVAVDPLPAQPARRRCVRCGCVLSRYSSGDVCMACEDREIAALVDREIEEAMATAEGERRRMERYALAAHE